MVQKYRKCSSNFSISECYFLNLKKLKHSWTPHSPFSFQNFQKKKGFQFSNFSKKRGGIQIFPIKMEGLVKQLGILGVFFLKRGGLSLIFILTNPFQCYLSLSVWCVCVLFIYTVSISIICVSQEEPNLIASNQQMYDFYKWIIFEKESHCGK